MKKNISLVVAALFIVSVMTVAGVVIITSSSIVDQQAAAVLSTTNTAQAGIGFPVHPGTNMPHPEVPAGMVLVSRDAVVNLCRTVAETNGSTTPRFPGDGRMGTSTVMGGGMGTSTRGIENHGQR